MIVKRKWMFLSQFEYHNVSLLRLTYTQQALLPRSLSLYCLEFLSIHLRLCSSFQRPRTKLKQIKMHFTRIN